MVFGKRCHEHISRILRKLQKVGIRENHVQFSSVLLSLITKPSIQFFGSLSSFVCHTRTPYVLPQRTYSIFLQGTVNNLMHYERSYSICCFAAPGNSLPLCIKAIPSLTRRCLKPCLNNKLHSQVLLITISIFVQVMIWMLKWLIILNGVQPVFNAFI